MLDNAEHIVDVVQSESGKTRADASLEVPGIVDFVGCWVRNAESFLGDTHPRPHNPISATKKLTVARRPYPVVGVITPWNFPFAMPGVDVPAALAAGAAVLLKPSEVTPLSASNSCGAGRKLGAPPVLATATGYGETGAAVVANVDFVQFTGSTATGRKIAVQCRAVDPLQPGARRQRPALVLADADLDRAASGIAWGGMFNSGQVCVSIERVHVEEPVYDDFVAKLTANVRQLRQGQDGRGRKDGYRYDVGAMATPPSATSCSATSMTPWPRAPRR